MKRSTWSVLPVRGIERGKTRLAPALTDAERAALNRWLLERTLAVIRSVQRSLRSCVVVSPCHRTLELARQAGARVVRETGVPDLNRAAALGASYAAKCGADRVMVIAGDLPDLDAESLESFTAAAGDGAEMVIAPDKHGSGTNALIVGARGDDAFRFGESSFARHREWAGAHGWRVSVVALPALAFDLDTPEDWAVWSRTRRDAQCSAPEGVHAVRV